MIQSLSTIQKYSLILGIFAAITALLYGTTVTSVSRPVETANDPSSMWTPAQTDAVQKERVVLPLFVRENAENTTISLDSKGSSITAITLRLQLADFKIDAAANTFTLDSTLEKAGWQTVINERNAKTKSFDLALINAQPDGGMVFTSDRAIGTFSDLTMTSVVLDSATSMAVTQDGEVQYFQIVEKQ